MIHTHFLIQLQEGLGIESLNSILNLKKFTDNISWGVEKFNNMIFLSIYSKPEKDKKFEQLKLDLIERVCKIKEYLSILYDSQTADTMKEISSTVYNLEREFRALIEIFFLNKFGKGWFTKPFLKNGGHNRRDDRLNIIKKLDNPLDDRDFKDLGVFVKEFIVTNNISEVFEKLENISKKIDDYENANKIQSIDITNDILNELENIKKVVSEKSQGFHSNEIYTHLNATVSKEWDELYTLRNYWAHNNCLITSEEFRQYNLLYSTTIKKIRMEITLLSLFNNDTEMTDIIDTEDLKLSIYKHNHEGNTICRIKGKLKKGTKFHSLQKTNITYKDLFELFTNICKIKVKTDVEVMIQCTLTHNPFLTDMLHTISEKIHQVFIEYSDDDTDRLLNELRDEKYSITQLSEEEAVKNDDIDKYLRQIFS